MQAEEEPAALLARGAAGVAAAGVSSLLNSMWMNGLHLPAQGQLASLQTRITYGLQIEMQKLQVSVSCQAVHQTPQ